MELSDQTFIAVAPEVVAAVIGDPRRWAAWWPDLELQVSRDRGIKGRQWVLTGRIAGTAEIYLEPWHDGTVVHLFLRLEPGEGQPAGRRSGGNRSLSWKRAAHRLKDELEGNRAAGTPVPGPGVQPSAQVEGRT